MDKKKDFAYKLGYALAAVVVTAATCCIVALAFKFILWLF